MIRRDDVDRFYEFDVWIPKRVIYMGSSEGPDGEEGGTDYQMAEKVIKGLTLLESMSKEPITIKMDNLGGDEYHGLAIYDAIRLCESPITVEVYGHAMSMGSWILQAADHRHLTPNATVMLHYGTWGHTDHWKHVENNYKEGKRLSDLMLDHYLERIRAKHPRFTTARLDKLLSNETYYTAHEAVDMGLADLVMPYPGEEE